MRLFLYDHSDDGKIMKLKFKLFLTYAFFLLAMVLIGVFGIRSATQVGEGFHTVNKEVVPLLSHLKDLRFAGLRIVSSTVEYAFIKSMDSGVKHDSEKDEETELMQQGLNVYRETLSLCRIAMSSSDVAKRDFDDIEASGKILLNGSDKIIKLAGHKGDVSKLLAAREEFEDSEKQFINSVSTAHDRVIGKLDRLENSAFYNITRSRAGIEMLLVFFFFSAIGIAFIFTSRITKRITLLKNAAERVAGGDLGQYVHADSRDELGGLSDSFNQMVEGLRKSQDNLSSAHNYLESIFTSVPDVVIVFDGTGRILDCNPSSSAILGYEKKYLLGINFKNIFSDLVEAAEMLAELRSTGKIMEREVCFLLREGPGVPFSISISSLPLDQNSGTKFICIAHSIAKRKEAEDKITALAYSDHLTGLPNRALFFDRFEQAIAIAKRNNSQMALLFFDLDHFKDINDTLGHHAGDLLLKAVASRLSAILRTSNSFARLGGDEFAFLCTTITQAQDAGVVASKIIDLFQQPFEVDGNVVFTSASIGVVIYPDDGANSQTLLKNADLAMYSAKEKGRKTFSYFSNELNMKAQERADIEIGLRQALRLNQLTLLYQPQVELGSNRVFGLEALCRWVHPEFGNIPPDKFIPVAEQTGMIRQIGDWVLNSACQQCAEWHKTGLFLSIAVNVSISQLQFSDFPDRVKDALRKSGLPPEYLELEITESLLMNSAEESMDMLSRLKSIGIKIAIDDFGTGYSSLSYLNKFSLDRIKIDKSFVREITVRDDSAQIVKAIVAIGHSLGLKVIAEGIETEEEQELLFRLSCDEAQGYLYSMPIPAPEVAPLVYSQMPLGQPSHVPDRRSGLLLLSA